MKLSIKITVFFLCLAFTDTSAQNIDHRVWTSFLKQHVDTDGMVNYKAIKNDETQLKAYLNQFVKTPPQDNWSKEETLAYWINAYNAFTIKLIIDNYPLKSIKDIEQPWDKPFIPINGQLLSLNHIEHNILRKMNEPRIHFAIVCASVSCPKLSNEAYTAPHLNEQLTKATKAFLADSSKNTIAEKQIEISKLFKWFSEDFTQNGSLIVFLNQYSDIKISPSAKIKYRHYNWSLNE